MNETGLLPGIYFCFEKLVGCISVESSSQILHISWNPSFVLEEPDNTYNTKLGQNEKEEWRNVVIWPSKLEVTF